jgi:hypothetical protein
MSAAGVLGGPAHGRPARDLPGGLYLPVLVLFAGLNMVRVGSLGLGVFAEAALVALLMTLLGLAALLRLRIRLPLDATVATAAWLACAAIAIARGDTNLGSSILITTCSWLLMRQRCTRPDFATRWLYLWPCLIGYAFQALYVAAPSLVVLPEAGGKYVTLGGLQWLRFEGTTLNANAYGLWAAVVLYGLREAGLRGPILWPGMASLLLTFSYSSIASLLFLVFCRRAELWRRIAIVAALLAILSAYSWVKGWGLAESIRIIKYAHYSMALAGESFAGILAGGLDRASHDWVVLTDNAWLTLLYDQGLVYLLAYFAAYALVLRHDRPLLALFLLANAIVDLQYFWLSNLAFLLVAEQRRTRTAAAEAAR